MINFIPQPNSTPSPAVLILPFFNKKVDKKMITEVSGIQGSIDFEGKAKEKVVLYHPTEAKKVYLIGLGDQGDLVKSSRVFRSLTFHQHKNWPESISVELAHLPAEVIYQAVLGIQLATYHPGLFKTGDVADQRLGSKDLTVHIIHADENCAELVEAARLTADTQTRILSLVDSPANKKVPETLAKYAEDAGEKYGYKTTVFRKKELEEKGLHTILAVGKGSINPPVMIIMEYNGLGEASKKPEIGLVGKGITFDTGGLSIKGSNNMHYMKSDMGGAAAVLGAVESAARLKLPIHVVGIIPSAENSVDAHSVVPGDVIDSYSGKTIEVIDTDAEGRLVLADGIAYMLKHFAPEVMIDLATLTGSCVRALGYAAAGLFSNNDDLVEALSRAGEETHERVWRLPLWKDYAPDIHSDIADVKNFSGKPIAGAISAAKFLEFFTQDHPQWAHLDIAGVAFGDSEFTKMKSASGYGIRLLLAFMQARINQNN